MSNRGAESVLVVHNPVCSKAEKAQEVIGWLMDSPWASKLEVVQTVPPSEGSNIDLIREQLRPGVVLTLSGDGGAGDAFNAIKRADEAGEVGAEEIAMVPVPTGSGNDLSRSLYRGSILRGHGRRLWDILERNEAAWLDGLKVQAGDRLDRYTHSFVGLGFTAKAAAAINEQEFRRRRAGRDIVSARALDAMKVLRTAVMDQQPFVYENGRGPKEAGEILYSLVPRVAAGVIRLDTHPLDGEAVHLEVGSNGFIPRAVAKLGSGVLFGGIKVKPMQGHAQEIKLYTPTAIQYDGEPDELPAGTTVTISHHREIVQALV